MKLGIATSIILALTVTMASAQEQAKVLNDVPAGDAPFLSAIPKLDQGTQPTVSARDLVTEQKEGDLLSSDLVGQDLFDMTGRKIGEVSDVLISQDRRLVAVIVELEGNGPPSRTIAIPFDVLRHTTVDSREIRLVASLDPSTLQAAKTFEPLSREAKLDDNQDLTTGSGAATGASVPSTK
jgi:sporulation protein YlmC with PRC-barrel domain